MWRLLGVIVLILAATVGAAAYFGFFTKPQPPEVRQAALTRGDILEAVTATGILQATRTVDIGSQVSGIVKKLYVDYNSIVHPGQVIAEMDPSTLETQVESSQASLDRANIDLDQARLTLQADTINRDREVQLFAHSLATQQDQEEAVLLVKEDAATITQDTAAVAVAADNLKQTQVNLSYCTIRSPVDGVVVTRNADEGQTVTASVSVPSLFIIATDIRKLDLLALVDESDIGKLHPGQDVIFSVAAYPNRQFHGELDHVRLNSVTSNNVIEYQAVASVKNDDLRLMPSMTAAVKVQIAQSTGAVRVPNAALHFRPTADMFKAFGQPVPPEVLAPPPAKPVPVAADQRPSPTAAPIAPPPSTGFGVSPMIDRSFKVMARPTSMGQVWIFDGHHLKNVSLKLGITDGTWTELLSDVLRPGDQVVTSVSLPRTRK